jgi:hypothetical protein
MKRIFIPLLFFFIAISAVAQVEDPNAQIREAKGFHGISVSSAFDVYLDQSNVEAVAVSAESTKDRDRIEVFVRDGILIVKFDDKFLKNPGNLHLKAYISFKQIDKLKISGACDVFIAGVLKASELDVKQSGASNLKGQLEVNKLSIDLSGASDMIVSGKTDDLQVNISGASDFKGFDLETAVCHLNASGASSIDITVNKELSARASGASDITVKGEGSIRDIKTSGGASVNRTKS